MKNIRRNFFRHIKRILGVVDSMGDEANHFRCIIIMGDQQEKQAYSYLHASPEDLKNLLLTTMRQSPQFTYAAACAFQQYDIELRKEESKKDKANETN